jgi:hypothetical protein
MMALATTCWRQAADCILESAGILGICNLDREDVVAIITENQVIEHKLVSHDSY